MTVNKITSAPTPNKQIEKINEIIDNLDAGGGSTTLSGLTDVTLTSPASGDVLAYNGSDWVNDSKYLKNEHTSSNGMAIGVKASGDYSVALRSPVTSTNPTPFGKHSTSLGTGAHAAADYSIQLGYGTATTTKTLYVGFYNTNSNLRKNWQLLDGTTGLIPDARLSSNIARMPDYTNKVLVASGRVATETSYTCPSDGWLYCLCIGGASGAVATIKINDLIVIEQTAASTTYATEGTAIFPVFSGDIVKYLMNYQYLVANRAIYFVPMKGV